MPKELNEIQLQNDVMFIINMHKGEKNPIDRWTFARKVFGDDAVTEETKNDSNRYDRRVRDMLEWLRVNKKMLICNLGAGHGYYLATSREEYDRWRAYYLGPSITKYQVVSVTDEVADEAFGKREPQPKPTPEGQFAFFS